MTLLVSWIGVDQRGPASLYLMSDSRISWKGSTQLETWDFGKKVFPFRNSPDIIGYCGDVLFATMAISHIVELADSGFLFDNIFDAGKKFKRLRYKVIELFTSYPERYLSKSISILFGSRVNPRKFVCYELSWSADEGWKDNSISYSQYSDKLFVLGSGAREFNEKYKIYQESSIKRTSRLIFQCFCSTLANTHDTSIGGAPQVVGLYRIKNAVNYGVVYKNSRFCSGVPVDNLGGLESVEWRNELFERVNGESKEIIPGAQKQPDPTQKTSL